MDIVDSHSHFDLIDDSLVMDMMADNGVSVVSWAFAPARPGFLSDFDAYFSSQKDKCSIGADFGVPVLRCVGIHPRSIPEEYFDAERVKKDDIFALLDRQVSDPLVVGIGEVGLESGSDVEIAVFRAQVEFAVLRKIPLCVHTPRKNKEEITKIIFSVLDEFDLSGINVLVDHLDSPWLVGEALGRGFFVGLTVSESKLSHAAALRLIEMHKDCVLRLMVNSDASSGDGSAYSLYLDFVLGLPEILKPVSCDTAVRFFGIGNQ